LLFFYYYLLLFVYSVKLTKKDQSSFTLYYLFLSLHNQR